MTLDLMVGTVTLEVGLPMTQQYFSLQRLVVLLLGSYRFMEPMSTFPGDRLPKYSLNAHRSNASPLLSAASAARILHSSRPEPGVSQTYYIQPVHLKEHLKKYTWEFSLPMQRGNQLWDWMEESLQPGLKLRAPTQPRARSLLGPRRVCRAGWEVPSLTPLHGSGASWGAKVTWQREFPGRYRTLYWCPSFGQSALSLGLCMCSWGGLLSPGLWVDRWCHGWFY